MPRLPRVYVKGALYYITCKGVHKEKIFREEGDYKMFLDLLKKYQEQYGIKLFSYVLLPDHLHLLIETMGREEQVSGFMHNLNNAYTKYYNSRYERKGHLFRGRFKAAIVEKAPHLLQLTAYMHLNPKRLNLVGDAKNYQYSTYPYYLNPKMESQFNLEQEVAEVLGMLRDKGYEELVNEITQEQSDKMHKKLQRGRIVGSEDFVKNIKKEIADLQSGVTGQAEGRPASKYRLFIVTSSFLMILVAGLGGIYFYYTATKTEQANIQEMVAGAIRRAEDLEATEWEIKLTPMTGGQQVADTLSFTQGQFVSGKLNTSGFGTSNYSLTIEDSGKLIWETMQTGPDGTATWRGEIEGNKMTGILSLRTEEQTQDFSFISVKHSRKR